MKVSSNYESPLVLDKIEIVESVFRKKDASLEDLELEVNVERNLSKIENDSYEVVLVVTVCDKEEIIYVSVKSRAIFKTRQENMDILEKNTIAIMFPYVRSYISIITTQPGMMPIVLPAMNIAAMIKDQKR